LQNFIGYAVYPGVAEVPAEYLGGTTKADW
jgi:hypothetical protein